METLRAGELTTADDQQRGTTNRGAQEPPVTLLVARMVVFLKNIAMKHRERERERERDRQTDRQTTSYPTTAHVLASSARIGADDVDAGDELWVGAIVAHIRQRDGAVGDRLFIVCAPVGAAHAETKCVHHKCARACKAGFTRQQ